MQKTLTSFLVLALALPAVHAAGANERTAKPKASAVPGKSREPARPKAARPAVVAPEPVGEAELQIAERVYTGQLPCELGQRVQLEADARTPGYFNVQGKGFRYHMRPVTTTTGAIRLEDTKAGAVWLQLANKSMLMDQKKGRRVADECAHPDQMAYAADLEKNPAPKLFETTGMGRND